MNDLAGLKFGRLTVLSCAGSDKHNRKLWLCLCKCGTKKEFSSNKLLRKHSRSCGCFKRDELTSRNTTHGLSRSKEHRVWCSIKTRCYNKKQDGYKNYGGRGITVCDRWLKSFDDFLADMGIAPSAKHTIERINNNGNYCAKNCKWELRKPQNRNTRSNIIIKHNGKKLCMAEWSEITGINKGTIRSRYHKGWTSKRILSKQNFKSHNKQLTTNDH